MQTQRHEKLSHSDGLVTRASAYAFFTRICYFGPVIVKMRGRGRRQEKRWICLFTFLSTRAIHLEVAHGMSMDEFLLCLPRFCSVRGQPSDVYNGDDNGKNFSAAETELKTEFDILKSQESK